MLTDIEIKKAVAKPTSYKLHDEKGMYLFVSKSGGKLFRVITE